MCSPGRRVGTERIESDPFIVAGVPSAVPALVWFRATGLRMYLAGQCNGSAEGRMDTMQEGSQVPEGILLRLFQREWGSVCRLQQEAHQEEVLGLNIALPR